MGPGQGLDRGRVGRDEACSGRGPQGRARLQDFFLLPQGWGFGTRIGVCSPPCFLLLSTPASLSRCLFSSKESACPPQGPKLPHCHPGRAVSSPQVSPSTSALSLVLSHGDREEGGCHLLGLMNATAAPGGGDGEVEPPCPGKAGPAPAGLGTISHHPSPWRSRSKAPTKLSTPETGSGAGRGPLPSCFCPSVCCDQPHFKHV